MRQMWAVVIGLAIVGMGSVLRGGSEGGPSTRPVGAAPATQPVKAADNSYCSTCHINMQEELLAMKHQKVGVGCATCHGDSDKHSSDENNVIPPDIMFAKDRINASCMTKCHEAKKLSDRTEHAPYIAAVATEQNCTDCHGKHSLSVRTRRWDKKTGKLIADDGVRMVEEKK